jgi:diaminohydroxyphosphoribosylaminopyrimidine deaminase/5-amino-6-(5-phosphoribosylamino)uracil reductase
MSEAANQHTERDSLLMQRARAVALTARRRTAPNPWVGCVLTDTSGAIVAEGATEPPGSRHAEAVALAAAGDRARGGTAYVTLEPCSHHGRTPPCADALVRAGIARAFVAVTDPDPEVAGQGIERLRAAGISVDVGLHATEITHDLAPYLLHRTEGRAFTLVKTAMSLDARTAAADGSSQWITGPAARADAHGLRADSQAVMVGAGTALADRPHLTVRDAEPAPAQPPLRVILDGRGRVPAAGPLFDTTEAPTLIVTSAAAPDAAQQAWLGAGAKVLTVPAGPDGTGVNLQATLETLGGLGVLQVLVEGGARLHAALLAQHLADRVVAYVAPTLLGTDGRAAFDLAGPSTIAEATRWQLTEVSRLGSDVRMDFVPGGVAAAPAVPEAGA